MFRHLVLILAAIATAAAQNNPEADIRAARERSNRAIATRNLKDFAESLDSDALIVRGNGTLVASKQEYVSLLEKQFADPHAVVSRRTPQKIEISHAAPLAAEYGRWEGLNPDGTVGYGGTYFAMWRRTDKGWKIRSELFVVLSCGTGDSCTSYTGGKN